MSDRRLAHLRSPLISNLVACVRMALCEDVGGQSHTRRLSLMSAGHAERPPAEPPKFRVLSGVCLCALLGKRWGEVICSLSAYKAVACVWRPTWWRGRRC